MLFNLPSFFKIYRSTGSTCVTAFLVGLVLLTQNALGGTGILHPGVKWRFKTQGAVRGQPILTGQLILVGSTDGRLYALGQKNGALKWSITTGAPITSTHVINEDWVDEEI